LVGVVVLEVADVFFVGGLGVEGGAVYQVALLVAGVQLEILEIGLIPHDHRRLPLVVGGQFGVLVGVLVDGLVDQRDHLLERLGVPQHHLLLEPLLLLALVVPR